MPRLPLAALVIGTWAPDLEYVLHLEARGKFGHTPAGLVVFCLPATLVLWAVWRALIRPALTQLLPPALRRAAEAPPPGRHSDVLPLAVFAALIGAATHILWDGFTHPGGWAVALIPALERPAFGLWWLPWFSVLQHISSVVGCAIVAIWIGRELRRHPAEARRMPPGERARLLRVAAFVAAVTLLAGGINALFARGFAPRLGRAAVGGMLGLGIALAAYGVFARWRAGETPRGIS